MLVIRLLRVGKKNQPLFRIVVTDKKNPPRGGRFLEVVGFYNPQSKEKKIKQDRIKYWLSVGAQPSATVYNLLVSEKILEGKKIPVHSKKEKEPSVTPIAAKAQAIKEKPEPEKTIKEEMMEKAEAESPKKEIEKKPKEEPKKEEKARKEEKSEKEPEK
jgi:small subunit ribosomal protein S16